MITLFTSDTHFGHGGALGLYRRPFPSVAAMNEAIVEGWNETVGPADVVWHLGDFAIRQRPAVVAELLARLNGHKHLLTGNNDPPGTTELEGWESVQPYAEITVDGASLVLCHYPFRSWRGMSKGCVNLHGHCHGRLKAQPRQFDVGVDVWGFRPVTLGTILGNRTRLGAARSGRFATG
jgi:calcineurin-like phosphoesterase family protein